MNQLNFCSGDIDRRNIKDGSKFLVGRGQKNSQPIMPAGKMI